MPQQYNPIYILLSISSIAGNIVVYLGLDKLHANFKVIKYKPYIFSSTKIVQLYSVTDAMYISFYHYYSCMWCVCLLHILSRMYEHQCIYDGLRRESVAYMLLVTLPGRNYYSVPSFASLGPRRNSRSPPTIGACVDLFG